MCNQERDKIRIVSIPGPTERNLHHISHDILDASREIQPYLTIDRKRRTNEEIVSVDNFRMNENSDFYVKKTILIPASIFISGSGGLFAVSAMCQKPE